MRRWPPKSPNVEVDWPKFAACALVTGTSRFGWLNRSKTFACRVSFDDSVILNALLRLKSMLAKPGPTTLFLPMGALHQSPPFTLAGHEYGVLPFAPIQAEAFK